MHDPRAPTLTPASADTPRAFVATSLVLELRNLRKGALPDLRNRALRRENPTAERDNLPSARRLPYARPTFHQGLSMKLLRVVPLGVLLLGCGNHFTPSPHMADAPAAQVAPSADMATLVFVRPSLYAGVMNPSIFVDGKYIGDVEATRQVVVTVPPGDHVVYSGMHSFFTSACRQLVAKVDANKIYFVEATVANGLDLFAARASDAGKIHDWLGKAPITRKAVDAASPLEAKEQEECKAKAAEHLAGDDPDDRAKHTLRAEDGFAAAP